MKLAEYAQYDGLGLAELVKKRKVSAKELTLTAAAAIEKVNPKLNAVVETYADRIGGLDEKALGDGPFQGVPFLIKDVFGHEKGRRIEFGSRLCKGMVAEASTCLVDLWQKAGVNNMGRSAAPEYSMSPTTESVMFGNTSNPWKHGYSAGGSSGGAQSAVTSGMVPIAHGSDIGGSIRIPASWCGGVGLKPSRMRISLGPVVDEGGLGYSMNFIQAKTMRDAAVMLDCLAVPQPGDPFIIPKPDQPYAKYLDKQAKGLKIGIVLDELAGAAVDSEVAKAVEATGKALAAMGHHVEVGHADMGGPATLDAMNDLFFFGFDVRLDAYAKRAGTRVGPETLEPIILSLYEMAKKVGPARFFAANGAINAARRKLGQFWTKYDVWLSPTTARVAEPWGKYHLSRSNIKGEDATGKLYKEPIQYTIPHNIMGTPAISLPLAMHSSGMPIGIQLAAKPGDDHLMIQLGAALEQAMPWKDRVPPLHVSTL